MKEEALAIARGQAQLIEGRSVLRPLMTVKSRGVGVGEPPFSLEHTRDQPRVIGVVVLVSLPMAGVVSSLNVSVATGICLYEIVRQRALRLA